MKCLLISGLSILFFFPLYAQDQKTANEKATEYFNNFLKCVYSRPNADSAYYFVKRLAADEKFTFMVSNLFHKVYGQEFIQVNVSDSNEMKAREAQKLVSYQILARMHADTSKIISETLRPLYLWVMIQDNADKVPALSNLTNEFIKTELSTGNIYKNSRGRYGLMIYQIISKHPELKPLAENLFEILYSDLKNNQIPATDSSSGPVLEKRAWYRYLYAYANYISANNIEGHPDKKGDLLKTAFDYSPDLIDKNHSSGYFYDMSFFFHGDVKHSFKTDYLSYLMNTGTDKTKILPVLLKIALVEPEYKDQLRSFYNTTGKDFNTYWSDAINANAKTAPSIFLRLVGGKTYSSKQNTGKWILLDFWGTWCAPCRKEHPVLQKFYDSVVLQNQKIISIITIACKDTPEKVLTYLGEKKFTFPVAMSDKKIEDLYDIQSYPTKILITPKGKYIIIPFGTDWVNFIRQYCDL
jgi:thiol-disulfide isomerase/thioredoxin